jgi:filamentous hemagglutinin family protein
VATKCKAVLKGRGFNPLFLMNRCFYIRASILNILSIAILCDRSALAQVSADGTLSTQVNPLDSANFTIDGGDRSGTNLFHSFREFSVPTNGSAVFNNAADVQNIFSRVTGGNLSNIDGLIQANSTANLFLLNPSGIVFGPNARLNLGGSFFASTADSLLFDDGIVFSATDPTTPPLLSINVPSGLQFGANPGNITVNGVGINRPDPPDDETDETTEASRLREISFEQEFLANPAGLRVQPGQTIGLIGGNVTLSGGLLKAPQGRVELGSVGANSRANLNPDGTRFTLNYTGVQNFLDTQLSAQAGVVVSGEGGGNLQIQGRRVTLSEGSEAIAATLGSQPGGRVTVRSTELVEIRGTTANGSTSGFAVGTLGAGNAGTLAIETGQLNVLEGGQVLSAAFSTGRAGDVNIRASSGVEVNGVSADGESTSQVSSATFGAGMAGNATINTGQLIVRGGGFIGALSSSEFASAKAGTVTVNASESVEIDGTKPDGTGSALLAGTLGAGGAGDIILNAGRLVMGEGGLIATVTGTGGGNAGNITVNASESVDLSGGSLLRAVSRGSGNAGSVTITTPRLSVTGASEVSAFTEGSGMAGNIKVNASESVDLSGGSRLSAISRGPGDAGTVTVMTSRLSVTGASEVSAFTEGTGTAGNVTIDASESVFLSGMNSGLGAGTLAANGGDAGTVTIDTREFILQDDVIVFAASFGTGRPGTINITADTIRQSNQAQLAAFSLTGTGGNINISSTEMRLEGLGSASGLLAYGVENQEGNINISTDRLLLFENGSRVITRDRNPIGGSNITIQSQDDPFVILFKCAHCIISAAGTLLIYDELAPPPLNFPDRFDPGNLVRPSFCQVKRDSQFVILGRTGLPTSPFEPLDATGITALDWVELPPESTSQHSKIDSFSAESLPDETPPLVEAQGWRVGDNGQIILTATPDRLLPYAPGFLPVDCHSL